MPMRAVRASTAHITSNLTLWVVVTGIATVVLGLARYFVGGGDHLGDLTALVGMIFGTLVMMKSQEGFVAPETDDAAA